MFKKTALLQGNHCACRSAKRLLYPNKNPYFTLNQRIFSVCSTVTNLLQAAIFLLFFTKIKSDKVGLKVVGTECSWHKIGLGASRSTSIQWPAPAHVNHKIPKRLYDLLKFLFSDLRNGD